MGEMQTKMYIGLPVKYPLFLSDFNERVFSPDFKKVLKISNFITIHPVEAQLFHADQQTLHSQ
jgi:hypothetical protein